MRVGFIIPQDSHNFNPFRNHLINVLHLLTILDEAFGDKIELIPIDLRSVKREHIIYYIHQCDLYLYSVTSLNFPETLRTVKELRSRFPKAKHVAGGIHIDIYPEDSARNFDVIGLGEGEDIIVKIVQDALDGCLKPNYVEPRMVDINHYPFPNRKFFPKTSIVESGILNDPYLDLLATSVIFSRGCCFKCHFCANLKQESGRTRTPENIKTEIEYLKREFGVQALAIKDDTVISPRYDTSRKTLEAIGETNVKWRGNCRGNGIPRDILKLAKQSGCVDLAVGIESVDQNVLNNINKRLNLKKAREFLHTMREEDIGVRLNIIFGLPGEPKDILQKTIEFIEDVRPSSVLFSILTPTPGSAMYHQPEKFGIKLNPDFSFDNLVFAFGRRDESEKAEMVFEYEKITPFGESLTNDEIINNYTQMGVYLREHKLMF